MFKRILLFVLTNIAIIIAINILIFLVQIVFHIDVYNTTGLNISSLAIFASIVWFGWAYISLQMSKWIAKRAYGIRLITSETKAAKLQIVYHTVQTIAQQNNIKIPEVGVYQSSEPNAFATWPSKNNSLVAVSSSLIDQMTDQEIKGVIGHEMAHILNGDMVTMTLLQWVINTFVIFLARVLAFIINNAVKRDREWWLWRLWYFLVVNILDFTLGIAWLLVIAAYSRKREYAADAGSAGYLGKQTMIASLQKLQIISRGVKVPNDEFATLKINNDEHGSPFATHPSLESRIQHLKNL